MAMQLDQVVPFGRSLDEYVRMFSLSDRNLKSSILSVADGPASFNAEGTAKGYSIQSVDPLYEFEGDEIKKRFYAVRDNIIQQIRDTQNDWVWNFHDSPDTLSQTRTNVTERFAADYALGKQQGRYITGQLPNLSIADNAFDLGLCSHFLFLYSQQFNTAFHIAAIDEMLRVCKEVRIFPLLTLMGKTSPHLEPVVSHLEKKGYSERKQADEGTRSFWIIETVDYELQKGGNKMLRIVTNADRPSSD